MVLDRAVMDYVIVPTYMRGRLLDMNVLRGVACGMSDHYLVDGVLRVSGFFFKLERRNAREVVNYYYY